MVRLMSPSGRYLVRRGRPYSAIALRGGAAGALGLAARAAYQGYKLYQSMPKTIKSQPKKNSTTGFTGNANTARTIVRTKPPKKWAKVPKKGKVKKLEAAVKNLRIATEADQGCLTYRWRQVGRMLCNVNSSYFGAITGHNTAALETVLAQLRYYNPSSPATLVTADGTTGTFMKDFTFDKTYIKFLARNNYQSPVKVKLYVCTVKDDTSIDPVVAYGNGLADIGAPSSTSTLVYLTDSPQFNDLWKIHSSESATLQPGEEMKITYSPDKFQYDPSLVDSHTQSFQTRYKGCCIVVRIEGVIGHDTTLDQQGSLQGGIDWQMDRTYVVKYSAGADIEYLVVNDQSSTFTNGGVASQKPIPDNVAYSVA